MNWTLKKIGYRLYQRGTKFVLNFMKYPEQTCLNQAGSIIKTAYILKENGYRNPLIFCSRTVLKNNLLDDMFVQFKENNISYTIFTDIQSNTTTHNVIDGYNAYISNKCDSIISIGGGSVMDCAKIVGIKVTNPKLSFDDMKKIFNIKNKPPFHISIPTTSGTGSESTVGAVITNPEKNEKYAVLSLLEMPDYYILDANLTLNLPPNLTAYTGMDALTHAIEAYIGTFGTKVTNKKALKAIKSIFENLETAYKDGHNFTARHNMLIASNDAAYAFTRAYTGYVHTISHAVSALYNSAHGRINAIILPHMLRFYGASIEKELSEIAFYSGLADKTTSPKEAASKVIAKIEKMNSAMNIPDKISELQRKDVPVIVQKALAEGNPNYPVPKIMSVSECTNVVSQLL